MAKGGKINERLTGWQDQLWEMRAFLFSTTDEFDEWSSRGSSDERAPIRRAAKFFDLDHTKSAHTALLLRILADVTFRYRRRGRRRGTKKWDTTALLRLGAHRQAVEKIKPGLSDSKAAKEIKERYKPEYKSDAPETIRQRLVAWRKHTKAKEHPGLLKRTKFEKKKKSKRAQSAPSLPSRPAGL
jgi:hypothetical protein